MSEKCPFCYGDGNHCPHCFGTGEKKNVPHFEDERVEGVRFPRGRFVIRCKACGHEAEIDQEWLDANGLDGSADVRENPHRLSCNACHRKNAEIVHEMIV